MTGTAIASTPTRDAKDQIIEGTRHIEELEYAYEHRNDDEPPLVGFGVAPRSGASRTQVTGCVVELWSRVQDACFFKLATNDGLVYAGYYNARTQRGYLELT